jgi:hypothetical protein
LFSFFFLRLVCLLSIPLKKGRPRPLSFPTISSLPPSLPLTPSYQKKGILFLEDGLDERVDLGATGTGIAALDEMRLLLLVPAL